MDFQSQPQAINPSTWSTEILGRKRLLAGHNIVWNEHRLSMAAYDMFVWDKAKTPTHNSFENHYISTTTVTKSKKISRVANPNEAYNIAISSNLDLLKVLGYYFRAVIGVDGHITETAEEQATNDEKEITVELEYPKASLTLNSEWLVVSDSCQADLNRLQRSCTLDDIQRFYAKYGEIVMETVYFGGLLRWSQASSCIEGQSTVEKAKRFKASIDARYGLAQMEASSITSGGSKAKLKTTDDETASQFCRMGGVQLPRSELRSAQGLSDWKESLDSPTTWEIIKFARPKKIEEVIGLVAEWEWVPRRFDETRCRSALSLPIRPRGFPAFSERTSLAFTLFRADGVEIGFVFFQDERGYIRFGDIGRHQHWTDTAAEVLFSEHIVHAWENSPLAAHIVPNPKGKKKTHWQDHFLFLFYVDDSFELCQHRFDFSSFEWREGDLPRGEYHPSDGSTFELQEVENGFAFSYSGSSGYNRAEYNYHQGSWSVSETWLETAADFEPLYPKAMLEHALPRLPGGFPGPRMLDPLRRQMSRYPPASGKDVKFVLAMRQVNNDVILYVNYGDPQNSHGTNDSSSRWARSIYDLWEDNSPGKRIPHVRDFCALMLCGGLENSIPGLLFVSNQGYMQLLTIEAMRDRCDFTCRHRTIFEFAIKEVDIKEYLT